MKYCRWVLNFLFNFVWKITGGIVFAILWSAIGIVLSLTLIGLPYAVDAFKIAYFSLKPFGKEVVVTIGSNVYLNILWAFSIGLVMIAISMVFLVTLTLSIFGIPLIYQWYKVLKVSIFPFGVVIM